MTDPRDMDERADEYVLGLLETDEARAVEAEADADPAMRAAVARSRDRFLALDLTATPVAPAPDVWPRIERGLSEPAGEPNGVVVAASRLGQKRRNMGPMGGWRMTAVAALAASLVLAVALGYNLMRQQPVVIAILLDDGGTPLAMVEDFGNASARVTPLVDFNVPQGRQMQVWTLPSAEMGPMSLGLLEASRTTVLDGWNLPPPREDQLYEITIEQAGGSPTGRPTGPILVKGFAKQPR